MRELKIDELQSVVGGTYGSTISIKPYVPASQAAYTPEGCFYCRLLDWWW
jgi:hypothetical protein